VPFPQKYNIAPYTACISPHSSQTVYTLTVGSQSWLRLGWTPYVLQPNYGHFQIRLLAYHTRRLRCIRPYPDSTAACTIATTIVHAKLDYRNSLYYTLPVCNVGVLWLNDWMDQDVTLYAGRPPPRRHCVRRGPGFPVDRGTSLPHFSDHVYCGQTVAHLRKCWCLCLVFTARAMLARS